MEPEILISTDASLLDIPLIHDFLSHTYWAEGRSIEDVQHSVNHSMCFGIYKNQQQIGLARVVTDMTVFAYIMDVFILESERGKGYARQLMHAVLSHPDLTKVSQWRLATRDAHSLYEKVGFRTLQMPERWMELRR